MNGSREIGPQIPNADDSSDDDESEADELLVSLINQLDDLESQQNESIAIVHEQLQKQRQAIDALRKSVRELERVIRQRRFSRQRTKIKRLKKLKAAGTPVYRSATPAASGGLVFGKESWSPIANETITTTAIPGSALDSTPTGMGISGQQSGVKVTTDTEEATLVGESPVNNHVDDIVMMDSDDNDDHPVPTSSHAPVAPPMEIIGSRRAGKKPATTEPVNTVVKEVAKKAAEVEKQRRPVPKMRPTRGGGPRGRGGTMRGNTSRLPKGGGTMGSASSRSDSQEPEPVVAPPVRGYGTARRAQPFKKGGATRSSSSAMGSDTGENIPTPVNKVTSLLGSSSRFVTVNKPTPPMGSGPSNWLDDWQMEDGTPLSALPAGASVARASTSLQKSLPPPRFKGKDVESPASPKKNYKRLHSQPDLPANPVLFSAKDLRAIFGGGSPGSIIVNVAKEGQQNAVVEYASYICLSPDAHFDPPGTMCDNAAVLDVDGQEDPLDSETVYPVWKKVGKAWMYCGDYTQGKREIVSVNTWKNSSAVVKKHWAKKVQETEWGRESLVRKGFRHHGEIKNNSVAEVLGYFAIPDDRKGLRLSATTLNFKTFNRSAYDRMVTKATTTNAVGLLTAPINKLGTNNLSAKPRASLLAAGDSDSPKVTNTPTPLRDKKRRRVEATSDEEEEAEKAEVPVAPQRRPVPVGSERGRRTSRNEVNYRIAPLSEFAGELERTGGEIISLTDTEDEDDDVQAQEKDEEEEEEEEEEEGEEEGEEETGEGEAGEESEGEMVID